MPVFTSGNGLETRLVQAFRFEGASYYQDSKNPDSNDEGGQESSSTIPEINLSQSGRDALIGAGITVAVVGAASGTDVPVLTVGAYTVSAIINVTLWYDGTAELANNEDPTRGDKIQWLSNTAVTFIGFIPMLTMPSAVISVVDEKGGFDSFWERFNSNKP